MIRILLALGLVIGLSGCVVKDELRDGIREVLPTLKETTYTLEQGGSGQVEFTFNYLLGIVDEAGIEEVRWEFSVITPQREILALEEQQMRDAQPGKTEILVHGDRARTLTIDGGLRPDGDYVLSIALFYRGELIGEKYKRLVDGETLIEEVEINDLPRF
ncbi:MAG: hypothetical protein ACI9U2_000217 [Bradymonadia bacterium]|jgi:hypothetical protein